MEIHEQIAVKYNVGRSSVGRFLQNKNAIRMAVEKYREYGLKKRRTLKEQHFPLMEEALFIWILQQREANIVVPADIMRTKADSLFREFQKHGCYSDNTFLASNGWSRRFKERHGLRMVTAAGEKASADLEAYGKFKTVLMQKILDMGINRSQLFNADESALFVKLIASKTVVLWDEKAASGRKLNKTRFTFMPCSNSDGSLKLKLMFIGKSENPRDLPQGPNKDLPVSYYFSKKAWMTRVLFRKWFEEEFVPSVRQFCRERGIEPKALLVLDNCSAHHDGCDLRSDDGLIQVIYLPPNVTSECQPMDQSVINAIKTRYKRKLMLKLVLEDEALSFDQRLKKVSLKMCLDWLAASWEEINPSTIRNSWNKLVDEFPDFGDEEFIIDDQPLLVPNEEATSINDNLADIRALVAAADKLVGTETSEESLNRWLNDQVVDAEGNLLCGTSQVYTDEEIINGLLRGFDESVVLDEEWLNDTDINAPEDLSSSHPISPEDSIKPDFSLVLRSLDIVVTYVEDDVSEAARLKSLRSKLIEKEWKRRNM
ncbi:jerky protein homolog-like [Armigeres subalbatus]|uniref:jerky protein homolog-like n=1 Tax=Armigeres subalbatus TaxID=124917 RepID=UPI002ED2637D